MGRVIDVTYWSIKQFRRELERREDTKEFLRVLNYWVNKLQEEINAL